MLSAFLFALVEGKRFVMKFDMVSKSRPTDNKSVCSGRTLI